MRLIWSPFAQANLRDINSYYGSRNSRATAKLIGRIFRSADNLLQYPNLGKPNAFKTCRLLQVPKTAYVLPYRVMPDGIEILAVFDQRQDKPDYLQ
jgi:plasmid stabilization system protein ParE